MGCLLQIVLIQGLREYLGGAERNRVELVLGVVGLVARIVAHDHARHLRDVAVVGELARGVLGAEGAQRGLVDLGAHVPDQNEVAAVQSAAEVVIGARLPQLAHACHKRDFKSLVTQLFVCYSLD